MGVFSSYTGKIFFPNWRIFFSQLEKKKAESCKLAFLAAPSHPHTYIHVRGSEWDPFSERRFI